MAHVDGQELMQLAALLAARLLPPGPRLFQFSQQIRVNPILDQIDGVLGDRGSTAANRLTVPTLTSPSCVACGTPAFHRASAAFLALSLRSSSVSLAAAALPPSEPISV